MDDYPYDHRLQCDWKSWTVVDHDALRLDVPADSYPDMTGAIKVARHVMPSVEKIEVWVDGRHDITYTLSYHTRKWVVAECRSLRRHHGRAST